MARLSPKLFGFLLLTCVALPLRADPPPQFTWLYGLQSAARAHTLGLNTLYLPTINTAESLMAARDAARAAQARGLHVIIALPGLSQNDLPADPEEPAFREEVGGRMRAVVRLLQDEPGITAWAMADYPERELRLTAQGFSAFLQRRYGSMEALNTAWGSSFGVWGEISLARARASETQLPYGVGRASVDAADYQVDALRRLLAFWAEQVRGIDSVRPLFTGRLALYRSIVSVPSSYTYIIPEAPVDVLEPDVVAQNVQAVDLARQGGAFEVVPSLRVPAPPDPYYNQGFTLGRWLREAQLHGARGVALDGTQRIRDCGAPDEVLRALGEQMRPLAGGFTVQPRPSLCVLYEPYAEGRQAQDVPTYGYLEGLAPGEPSVLMAALRLGSKFGLVDYLSLERLIATDLDSYSAILAPCALHLPLEAQGKLRNYVERGGRLICDLGAGLYESGSWQTLPPDLALLCGIDSLGGLQERSGDLSFGARSGLFPSLEPPLTARALEQVKPADGVPARHDPLKDRAWLFRGPTVTATLGAGASAVGTLTVPGKPEPPPAPPRPQAPRPSGMPGTGVAAARTNFAGLIAHPFGLGWAAFCTAILWARWDPADPAFALTHGDLWGFRAPYALQQPGLWPGAVEMCAGQGTLWLYNVTTQPLEATILVRDAGGSLAEGAFAWIPLSAGPVPMELLTTLPPGQVFALRERPVRVLPVSSGVYAHLREYSPGQIRLEVAGPGAQVTSGLAGQRNLTMGENCQAIVMVSSGDYVVAPGSQHRVKLTPRFGDPHEIIVQAGDQGVLSFPVEGVHVDVEISAAVASG